MRDQPKLIPFHGKLWPTPCSHQQKAFGRPPRSGTAGGVSWVRSTSARDGLPEPTVNEMSIRCRALLPGQAEPMTGPSVRKVRGTGVEASQAAPGRQVAGVPARRLPQRPHPAQGPVLGRDLGGLRQLPAFRATGPWGLLRKMQPGPGGSAWAPGCRRHSSA